VGFNEDGLFGWTLRVSDPDAFILQLPYAVVHDSARGSRYDHRGIRSASQVRTCEVVQWLCRPWLACCFKRSVAGRLRSLAGFLQMLGEMELAEFRAHLKKTVVEAKCESVSRCDAIQEDFPYPEFWQQALAEYRLALLESLSEPGFYVPVEWKHDDTVDGVVGLQRYLRMYGRALDAWPALWEYWRVGDPTHWAADAPCEGRKTA
jgi:hypothetical protein